ncbi:nitrate ABC transporter permease [Sphaerospermopsis aphanizomenoides BCCUSP55]|uniref:nitrate ABC transporter permease n=1 Tax=Sphaerospermopsis aphanizomenoides TaxID=459663 RepID=UPI001908BC3D|nr:nitrate ABC transporter permease [Sphaerospermopsis aphanizomenoides]MBK1989568.1 nitrate ABC transporter permease [Sphaerospermopsis aphanizomenoides BCCUSP55]
MAASVGSRKVINKQQKAINKFVVNKVIPPLVALAVFLVIWQLLCLNPNFKLPGPIETISETWDPFIIHPFFDNGESDKGLGWQILNSLGRVGLGFSLAVIVGVALGIFIGVNKFLYNAVDPIFQVLRTIPPLAWLPISLAAFQQANPSAIFVIFITSIWPILINTTVGVQNIPQDYVNVARVLKLKGFKYYLKIVFPATVPYIFTGLRIGIGLSWLAIVAAEMLVGGVGIGSFIWDAYNTTTETNLSEIIIALVYVGLVGLILDRMVAFIADKVVQTEHK